MNKFVRQLQRDETNKIRIVSKSNPSPQPPGERVVNGGVCIDNSVVWPEPLKPLPDDDEGAAEPSVTRVEISSPLPGDLGMSHIALS